MDNLEKIKTIRNIGVFTESKKFKVNLFDTMFTYTANEKEIRAYGSKESQEGGCGSPDINIVNLAFTIKTDWLSHQLNIVDIPTKPDFEGQLERSLMTIDGAFSLFSAVESLDPMAEALWKERVAHAVPSIAFMTQMGQEGAEFWSVVQQIEDRLEANLCLTQLPIYNGKKLEGIVDLIQMREYIWHNEQSSNYVRDDLESRSIRDELLLRAKKYRTIMMEQLAVVDANEGFMQKLLAEQPISDKEIVQAIRKATLSMAVTPLLLGCPSNNHGIHLFLDAIVQYLPSPLDTPKIEVSQVGNEEQKTLIDATQKGAPLGFVSNIILDPFVGTLAVVRLYRGSLSAGQGIYNANKQKKDRVHQLYRMQAHRIDILDQFSVGEVGFVFGMKHVSKGDTLCESKEKIKIETSEKERELILFTEITSIKEADATYLVKDLLRKMEGYRYEEAYLRLYGYSKPHLEHVIERVKTELGLSIEIREPQVVYPKTIKEVIHKEFTYKEQEIQGKREQFAHICFKIEPQERGYGYRFVDETKGGIVPKEFIGAMNKGIEEVLSQSIQAGYPIVDLKVTLYDGSYHDVDSSMLAFKNAGVQGFREAYREANPVVLEPIMKVEIEVSEKYQKNVLEDIAKRRGIACARSFTKNNLKEVYLPLAEILEYDSKLDRLTNGTATYRMEFDCYEELPSYLFPQKLI